MTTGATILFLTVVGARFLVPLLIPLFPLPAIVAALVLDGIDQSIFQAFGYDPPGYQGYDKAMDVYYLAIAYLSTMRNWTSRSAFGVGRFLYFYRLVGVTLFEFTHWRPILLIFPNTFEYFFIAYEVLRLRWDPVHRSRRFWIVTAAVIWICVKLPQEYWIHVAQLDVTDMLHAHPEVGVAVALVLVAAAVVVWFAVLPRLPAADWSWRVAAEPLPAEMDTAVKRDRWVAAHGRVLSGGTLEKVVLVGLISLIYGNVLPDRQSTNAQLFVASAVFVVLNAAVSLAVARGSRGVDSVLVAFVGRVLMNVGFVVVAGWLLGRGGGHLNEGNALFFVLLLSLITLLDDRYRPVHDARFAEPSPLSH